jgi:hypothetical protein
VGEDGVGHTLEIVVEKRPQEARIQGLGERREPSNVREQRGHLAALSSEIEAMAAAGELDRKGGREVARQRCVRALGLAEASPCIAQHLHMTDRLGDRALEVGEVDGLRQEVESPAVHGGADVGHVAVGRDDDCRGFLLGLL